MRYLFLATLLTLSSAPASAGGGWVRPAGTTYVSVDYGVFASHEYYALRGELRNRGSEFQQHFIDLRAEYGCTARLTAEILVPALRRLGFESTESITGFGDLHAGLKYGWPRGNDLLALSFTLEAPTGRDVARARFRDDEESFINLPTGDGEWNYWLRAGASRSLGAATAYLSLDAGYNARTEGFSDQYDVNLDIGARLLRSLWIRGRLRNLDSVGARAELDRSFVYGEGTEFLELGIGVEATLSSAFSLNFQYARAVARQRNVYGGGRFATGLAFHS